MYDYTPARGDLYAVIDTESAPEALLGMWVGTTEDVVTYADTGADEELHNAPSDCVRLVRLTR